MYIYSTYTHTIQMISFNNHQKETCTLIPCTVEIPSHVSHHTSKRIYVLDAIILSHVLQDTFCAVGHRD